MTARHKIGIALMLGWPGAPSPDGYPCRPLLIRSISGLQKGGRMKIILKILDGIGFLICSLIFGVCFCSWTELILRMHHVQLIHRYLWIYIVFLFLPTATFLPYKRTGCHVFSWITIGLGLICTVVAVISHYFFNEMESSVFFFLTFSCILLPWGLQHEQTGKNLINS